MKFRFLITLAALVCSFPAAGQYKNMSVGINRTPPTAKPVCILNGAACEAQIGTLTGSTFTVTSVPPPTASALGGVKAATAPSGSLVTGVTSGTGDLIFSTYPLPFAPAQAWAASTAYSATSPVSIVWFNNTLYLCITSHTSTGTFDSTKWQAFLSTSTVTRAFSGTTDTLGLADDAAQVFSDGASPVTETLPATFPRGYYVVFWQVGAGQVTFSPAAGASINTLSGYTKTAGAGAQMTLSVISNSGGSNAVWAVNGQGAP